MLFRSEFITEYCSTDLMISDGLTKPKTANDHAKYCEMIGVMPDPRPDFTKERAVKTAFFMHDPSTYDDPTEDAHVQYNRGYDDYCEIDEDAISETIWDESDVDNRI